MPEGRVERWLRGRLPLTPILLVAERLYAAKGRFRYSFR